MAIQHHPLSNELKPGKLVTYTVFDSGSVQGSLPNWECLFSYEKGSVRMSMVHGQAVYNTVMDEDSVAEGPDASITEQSVLAAEAEAI